MGWLVIVAEPALADLERIVTEVSVWDPNAALSVGTDLVDAIFSLDFMPARGSPLQNRRVCAS
jgi:hypothetical protein